MVRKLRQAFKNKKIIFYTLGSLVVVAFLIWSAFVSVWGGEGGLSVYFLDVGQGDSILIDSPAGQVLIDGGPNKSVLAELGEIMPFYDKTIELIILTHPDSDHINGLVEVLRRFKVERVIETKVKGKNEAYKEWRRLIEDKNIESIQAIKGDRIELSKDIILDFWWPEENIAGKTVDNLNDTSLICLLDQGETEMLLAGDAELGTLEKIAKNYADYEIEILKQPHHGAKNGSSELLLQNLSPTLSVISAGAKNRYGHPHQETLNLLEKFKVDILRTDEKGTIKVIIDKDDYRVETEK